MNRKDTKRKVGLVAAALLLVSMLSFGTLAYFTDAEAATNVMTAGNVEIVLLDQTDVNGTLADFNETFDGGKTGVMPGDVVSKVVTVENVGTQPAWVRVKVDQAIVPATLTMDGITLDFNYTNWTSMTDGYFYYNSALAAAATTEPLFTGVSYSSALGNDYMNAVVTIYVSAEAVQVANNGSSFDTATGWPVATP